MLNAGNQLAMAPLQHLLLKEQELKARKMKGVI